MKGTIKWFSQEKGYGFITAEDNQDYFFGVRDVIGVVLPTTSSQVTFTPSAGPKGPKATEISILSQPKSNTQDNRIECPHCAQKIVPRIVIYRGEADKSLCPFCGGTVKQFSTSLLDFISDILMGIIKVVIIGIINVVTAIIVAVKKSKKNK